MLDDFVTEDNSVRVEVILIDNLELKICEFKRVITKSKDRSGYHPAILLKLTIYDYLNRI
ncbi:ISCps6, transposase [Paraglaciecola psychrophila 170]|uniref:ISCps6, transposase n=1 Tax=Paraglaciecola psychrophila 170 TaxID=1129794 RepID=K6ZV12_9ALTE|nr:ISCps6, transposase [Paraglaciecola psychrophila 170]GAC39721.1 hypothetical protein GPSY_4110 [Paraglaciecola psychrophila 170]